MCDLLEHAMCLLLALVLGWGVLTGTGHDVGAIVDDGVRRTPNIFKAARDAGEPLRDFLEEQDMEINPDAGIDGLVDWVEDHS
jgi:hypothetical protein